MKEITREELPTDGTHFVVTWVYDNGCWSETCRLKGGKVQSRYKQRWEDIGFGSECTNIRFWQFPEGETT